MQDPNTPSWLSGTPAATDVAPPAPTNDALQTVPVDSAAAAPAGSNEAAASAVDESDLPGVILIMRLANMGAAVALMTCSVSECGSFSYPGDSHTNE